MTAHSGSATEHMYSSVDWTVSPKPVTTSVSPSAPKRSKLSTILHLASHTNWASSSHQGEGAAPSGCRQLHLFGQHLFTSGEDRRWSQQQDRQGQRCLRKTPCGCLAAWRDQPDHWPQLKVYRTVVLMHHPPLHQWDLDLIYSIPRPCPTYGRAFRARIGLSSHLWTHSHLSSVWMKSWSSSIQKDEHQFV